MSASGNRWEDYFGDKLRAKGYDDITIAYDPGYGWLVNYGAGEFEAPSTAIVTRRIEALPWAASGRETTDEGAGRQTEGTAVSADNPAFAPPPTRP